MSESESKIRNLGIDCIDCILKIGRDFQNMNKWHSTYYDMVKLLCDTIEYLRKTTLSDIVAYMLLGIVLCVIEIDMLRLVFKKSIGHCIFGWYDCDATGFSGVAAAGMRKYCRKKCL